MSGTTRRIGHEMPGYTVLLCRVVNNNERRFERWLSALWYCYYDRESPGLLERGHEQNKTVKRLRAYRWRWSSLLMRLSGPS